jgi:hypothetical protein
MNEGGISWKSDRTDKFKQPDTFKARATSNLSASCADVGLPSNCKHYTDASGQHYLFWYPKDDSVQYLYETYPGQVSPVKGVTDEHFIVWMRTAALPQFRKLYGRIAGPFKKGEQLSFDVEANYEVNSFDGSKALLVSTIGEFGGKNKALGVTFVTVGALSLSMGIIFALKQLIYPRALGDPKLLRWDTR